MLSHGRQKETAILWTGAKFLKRLVIAATIGRVASIEQRGVAQGRQGFPYCSGVSRS
jgi:hypothetical protein